MSARRKLGRGGKTARKLNTSLLLIAHFGRVEKGARLSALLAMGSLRRGRGVPRFAQAPRTGSSVHTNRT